MNTEPEQTDTDKGQISSNAAIIYEDFFVPAIFQEWAQRVMEAAKIKDNDSVLDVACGTGILARTIAKRLKPKGEVIGLDLNEGMLKVAAHKAPEIEWVLGPAEAINFDDERFDAVVSQFGLMFFTDRLKALKEMMRVLKDQGRLAVAVWDSLEHNPGYSALVDLLQRLFGDKVANLLRNPFALGEKRKLLQLFKEAGINSPLITTFQGMAHFPSVRSWVYTDVKGWTMGEMINDQQLEELTSIAEKEFSSFVSSDGTVTISNPAHIITARKD